MKIDVLTLFPEMFVPVTGSSILGRAAESGILEINLTDIRDFSNDKHNKADDYPFGGGGGMVMMADPVFGALESVEAEHKKVIYMSPRGRILDQEMIQQFSSLDELVILCGHYFFREFKRLPELPQSYQFMISAYQHFGNIQPSVLPRLRILRVLQQPRIHRFVHRRVFIAQHARYQPRHGIDQNHRLDL